MESTRGVAVAKALVLVLTSGVVFLGVHRVTNPEAETSFASWRVDEAMESVFQSESIDRAGITGRLAEAEPARVQAVVPPEASLTHVNAELTRAVRDAGGRVFEALETGRDPELPERVEMTVGRNDRVTHRLELRQAFAPADVDIAPTPRIAIVFDDLGYTLDGLAAELMDLPVHLTFAVLPGLPHSQDFAASAAERGHDVILHLPMEPVNRKRHDPGPQALLVDLDTDEIRRRLRHHLDGFGGYIGVSNHMGSRFTADTELMKLVLSEIRHRDRGLFFLDSSTTPYSRVGEAAARLGVACVENNVFLDRSDESTLSARARAERVAGIARRNGYAVAIGHVRGETVQAVRQAIEFWESEGILLVGLSELMARKGG